MVLIYTHFYVRYNIFAFNRDKYNLKFILDSNSELKNVLVFNMMC